MRKAYRIIIVLGFCLFLFSVYKHSLPALTFVAGIILIFSSLVSALLVTVIIGFTRWRKSSRFWMIPTLLCLTFMSSPFWNMPIRVFLDDQHFKRHLNEYIQVVDDVKNGVIPCGEKYSRIDVKKPPSRIVHIFAARCSDGKTVLVDFFFHSSVMYHSGYVFKGYNAENDDCITKDIRPENRWPSVRHITGNWYQFSD